MCGHPSGILCTYLLLIVQALQSWSETIVKEDQVEKEVLQKLTDPSQVHFLTSR